MSPSYGKSGLRGIAVDFTDDLIAMYFAAFLTVCQHGGYLFVGYDYRESRHGLESLQGLRIGVYRHSSVARDVMQAVLEVFGAFVLLGHSDHFIPVNKEAIAPEVRTQLATWAKIHQLDAIVSTYGDGDRPMVCDVKSDLVLGDVLGVIRAHALGANMICTPVTSNAMVTRIPALKLCVNANRAALCHCADGGRTGGRHT